MSCAGVSQESANVSQGGARPSPFPVENVLKNLKNCWHPTCFSHYIIHHRTPPEVKSKPFLPMGVSLCSQGVRRCYTCGLHAAIHVVKFYRLLLTNSVATKGTLFFSSHTVLRIVALKGSTTHFSLRFLWFKESQGQNIMQHKL